MSWLNATQVLPESQNESSQKKKGDVGYLIILNTNYVISCGENKIGRDPSQCSIVLENKTLSKVHAVIESEGPDETFIYDEKSTNKTRLGKTVLKPHCRYKINDGDTITFGNVVAKYKALSEADDSDIGSQSLLSPCKTPKENKNNQKSIIYESPSFSDSLFEANTQCRLDGAASSPDVFKTPQSVKSKCLQSRSNSDDLFSAVTQNCLRNDESSSFDDSDIYEQPTQCNFKTPDRPCSSRKNKISRKLDDSYIFEMATQCQLSNESVDDSVFEQATQIPENNLDNDVFEAQTQCVVPGKRKSVDDSVFEAATQVPNGKEESSDEDNDVATQESNKNRDIFDLETQIPDEKVKLDDDYNLFEAATQVTHCRKDIFEAETQVGRSGFSEEDNLFEAETQAPNIFEAETQMIKSSEGDTLFDAATQQPAKSNSNYIFEAETQAPVKEFPLSSPNASDPYIFEAETQCPAKKINVSQDDSNELIGALPDSIFEENTQIPKKTPDSGKKARKRPMKHDNILLFKNSKRRSTEDYLNDGQDEVLCEFMSQNSPVYAKKEKDAFEEDFNLEGVSSQVFEMDTQMPVNSHTDSGISDEGNSTQAYSPNATGNDSGVKDVNKINIDEKGKEDLIPTQLFKNKTVPNSVNMVMSSSSDEDCDVRRDTRALEDLIPTQVVSQKNNRQIEDDIPTQVVSQKNNRQIEDDIPTQLINKRNEDEIQTQKFKTEDNIANQVFNNRVVESSDDETDSDIDLPRNKEAADDSETDSDVEVKQSVNIEMSTSGESNHERFEIEDKSDDSFSMIKEGENSTSDKLLNVSGSDKLNETGSTNFSPERDIVKVQTNQRNMSPTQVMSEDDLFDDKNDSNESTPNLRPNNETRKHICSPTQVMSDPEIEIKNEASYDETQVLPLSPPANYEPRVLNSQDAWMIGKDPESECSTPKRPTINDEESTPDWDPISLQLPSTQEFEKAVKEISMKVSPDRPIGSKRLRDSEDLETPRSKLKKENSPIFKSPRNLFNNHDDGEILIGPNAQQNQRPHRVRKPTWKVISEEEDSPVIQLSRCRKKINVIEDESQDEDSPIIRVSNRTKPKPMIFEESMLSQVYEDERSISKRRSARIQKSNSNSSCNSLEMESSTKNKRKARNSRKKSFFPSEPKIIFTGYESENQFKIIEDLDGERTTDLKDASVVVTDKVRRTVKFLSALALGLPIVSPTWLEKCGKEMEFIDPWPFLLHDKEAEDRYEFNLKGSIAKAKKKKMLDGYSVFATANAKPPVPELMSIVQCCGGKPLFKCPDIWPEKTIIISCPEDMEYWPPKSYRYVKIVHYEFLLTGVLKQTLEFNAFKLR